MIFVLRKLQFRLRKFKTHFGKTNKYIPINISEFWSQIILIGVYHKHINPESILYTWSPLMVLTVS